MKMNYPAFIGVTAATTVTSCTPVKKEYASYELYPVRSGSLTGMEYLPEATKLIPWVSTADEVRLMLSDSGEGGRTYETIPMELGERGTWTATVNKDLVGKSYTFSVKVNGKRVGDTSGISAKVVGVNGKCVVIIDLKSTDPQGWESDQRPPLKSPADAVVYEMHHRDFSVDSTSGIWNKGEFLAPIGYGTLNPTELLTGIDHLVELGVTHVHLLPPYDYASMDETKLNENKYNWGYDPQSYNVPDSSYSIDPYDPAARIREFKQMVQALHKAGIRVVLDMVCNHTYNTDGSNFERTVPGYLYRQKPDGSLTNGSACGDETISNRLMMRKYMIESMFYWIKEYHIDSFRSDLMGIHDVETMNEIRKVVNATDPSIIIYGGDWVAEAPQYPEDSLVMKANTFEMSGIAAFSDELRDALRDLFNDNHKGAFLAGIPGGEESTKFGIVGAIQYPQVNNDSVNYSKAPWAAQPTQMISYMSCHDDMCLVDHLKSSIPDITPEQLARLDKLAQMAMFTSQGAPFIYAGEEAMHNKKGVHNSFESPDSINAIDWNRKAFHEDVFAYYKRLISLRKAHPVFRMGDAEMVCKYLEFLPVEGTSLIAFRLKDRANGDSWNNITVVLNAHSVPAKLIIPEGKYTVVCKDGVIDERGLGLLYGPEITVLAQPVLIIH